MNINIIQAKQFERTKFGDRHFFTHAGQVSSFTADQLSHIRSRKFSDIICDNSNLETIPIDVFKMASSPGNEYDTTKINLKSVLLMSQTSLNFILKD